MKKILTDAGVKMPFKIELRYPESDTANKQAAALKETWDQAGFAVSLPVMLGTGRLIDRFRDRVVCPDPSVLRPTAELG